MPGKRKPDRLKDTYDRIRKPVPPPPRIEEDRRRKIEEELLEREADEDLIEEGTED